MTENIQKYPDVNRVEVISSEGEEFVWDVWDECSKVQDSIFVYIRQLENAIKYDTSGVEKLYPFRFGDGE